MIKCYFLKVNIFSVVLGQFLFLVTTYCILKYTEAKFSNINTFYIKVVTQIVLPTVRLLCKASRNEAGHSYAFSTRITGRTIVKPVFDAT
jgi:hypothetical protein